MSEIVLNILSNVYEVLMFDVKIIDLPIKAEQQLKIQLDNMLKQWGVFSIIEFSLCVEI